MANKFTSRYLVIDEDGQVSFSDDERLISAMLENDENSNNVVDLQTSQWFASDGTAFVLEEADLSEFEPEDGDGEDD